MLVGYFRLHKTFSVFAFHSSTIFIEQDALSNIKQTVFSTQMDWTSSWTSSSMSNIWGYLPASWTNILNKLLLWWKIIFMISNMISKMSEEFPLADGGFSCLSNFPYHFSNMFFMKTLPVSRAEQPKKVIAAHTDNGNIFFLAFSLRSLKRKFFQIFPYLFMRPPSNNNNNPICVRGQIQNTHKKCTAGGMEAE